MGFMVSQRGIEVNPEKVRTIMELAPSKIVKEVQNLNGKIAALNKFVSWARDKFLPFFRTEKIPQWNIYKDESSNRQAGGSGVVLSPQNK